ncbi:stage III sporulation protein AB [Ruminococcus sp. zg-924]|uniref:stage III sporulation protein AB n=1 Tax=Ruminococcus sp. zg-924 TaxID=2678505 RepID=UPI00210C3EFB|nr:stage III sporulation protein AB [Ruminococcus sp. zg-924]
MIISAGVLSGVLISRKTTNRILFFEQLLLFLTALREKLGYTLSDISTLLCTEQKMIEPLLITMSENLMHSGTKKAAKTAVSSISSSYGLKDSDKKLLLDFFSELGLSDCDGQLAHCDLYISLVKQLLDSQREESIKKSKLYRMLGTFCGIGAGLFFL